MVASQSSAARDVGSTSASGSATTWAAAYAIRLLGGPGGSSRTARPPGAYGASEPSAYGSRTCSVISSLLLGFSISRLLPPPARRAAEPFAIGPSPDTRLQLNVPLHPSGAPPASPRRGSRAPTARAWG